MSLFNETNSKNPFYFECNKLLFSNNYNIVLNLQFLHHQSSIKLFAKINIIIYEIIFVSFCHHYCFVSQKVSLLLTSTEAGISFNRRYKINFKYPNKF